jgi:hypothetical protein
MTFYKVRALARMEKYCNPLVAEIEYVYSMTKMSNIFVMLLISVVNEVERKLAGILIQNHNGDKHITNILLVGETGQEYYK